MTSDPREALDELELGTPGCGCQAAFDALGGVLDLADQWTRAARDMCMAGGESPRPQDYSEGHYVGVMKTRSEDAAALRHAITTALEGKQ